MDTVCHNLQFTFVYIDDILVASPDNQTHKEHLRLLFQWLQQYSLVINVAKYQFGCNNIDFLGHCISHAGTAPLPDKVEVITQMQPPETTKGLQEFVGMVNFYRRFIPSAAHIMLLFNALANKQKSLTWTEIINDLFQATKKALAGATLLAHLCQGAPTSLTMNASDHAVRVVLQSIEGVTVPLAFFSRKLRPPEKNYSTFDRLLLALYFGGRHFHYFLEGRQFTAFTDHKSLTYSVSKTSELRSTMQQCQLSYISEFTTDIQLLHGSESTVADTIQHHSSISPWHRLSHNG